MGATALLAIAGALAEMRRRSLAASLAERDRATGWWARRRAEWVAARALPSQDPARRRLWIGAEVVFAVAFFGMALLVAYSPEVWGTEKPMDMAFINAANASSSFPPHDPWMAGEDLNYYYLGHLSMAMVLKVMGSAPDEGYNLAVALVAALSAAAVFTLGGTLWAAARPRLAGVRGGPVAAGLAAVVVCIVLGNLAGVRAWLDAAGPPGDYDWFAPSRVVPGTINEFPWFSFLLEDLHAHVLALPFTVLALAFALQVVLVGPRGDAVWRGVAEALAAGLAVGALYPVNSWSYPVAAGLLVLAVGTWLRSPESAGRRDVRGQLARARADRQRRAPAPVLAQLRPGREGHRTGGRAARVQRVPGRPGAALRHLRGRAVGRVRRARARQPVAAAHARVERGGGDLRAGRCSRPPDLAGPAVVAALLAVALGALFSSRLGAPERFFWLLVAGGLICVLTPELVVRARRVRRQRPVPHEHGLQARLPGVAAAGDRRRVRAAVGGRMAAAPGVAGVGDGHGGAPAARRRVPVRRHLRAQGRLQRRAPTLDGLAWLRERAPGDPAAIDWLRARTPGTAVVLEAVGEDYSAFGHARISTFTGRATVLGWPGHELQWDHEPGSREADVRTLYTTTSLTTARG